MDNMEELKNVEWSRILENKQFVRIRTGHDEVTIEYGEIEDGPTPDQDAVAVVKMTTTIDVETAFDMASGLATAADKSIDVVDRFGGVNDVTEYDDRTYDDGTR
jgi:hypothetical protein